MIGVLVIILLAALAGLIKPYISGLRRGHFALAALAAFILIGVIAPKTDDHPKAADSQKEDVAGAPAAVSTDKADETLSAPAASKWSYSEDKDAMRGTTTRYASLESENTIDLEFPYGEVRGKLWVRRRPEDGLNVMFAVEKGQILCHSFSNSTVAIKFDDGPVRKFRCTTSSDGSSETAFLSPESKVLAALKASKHAIVEAEFYQQGRQQFEFDTAGLNWK